MKKRKLPTILKVNTEKTGIFTIQSMELRFSNGVETKYWRLKPSTGSAVTVVAIDNNDLLLISEFACGTERYELGFVRGGIDDGEDLIEAAQRELQEEIGYAAKNMQFIRTVNMNTGYQDSKMHILLATDLYESKLEGDEPEPIEIIRYPLKKISELLKNEQFSDSRNLVALYIVKDLLQY